MPKTLPQPLPTPWPAASAGYARPWRPPGIPSEQGLTGIVLAGAGLGPAAEQESEGGGWRPLTFRHRLYRWLHDPHGQNEPGSPGTGAPEALPQRGSKPNSFSLCPSLHASVLSFSLF